MVGDARPLSRLPLYVLLIDLVQRAYDFCLDSGPSRRFNIYRHSSLTEPPDALIDGILCSTTSSVICNLPRLFGEHILLSPTCDV